MTWRLLRKTPLRTKSVKVRLKPAKPLKKFLCSYQVRPYSFLLVTVALVAVSFFLVSRLRPELKEDFTRLQDSGASFKPIFGRVVNHGLSTSPKISLTFDADMTPSMLDWITSKQVNSYFNKSVIDILRSTKTPATIFVTGLWANYYKGVVRELAMDPLFEIGNHSYSHSAFSQPCFGLRPVNSMEKDKEFFRSQQVIREVTGLTPRLFRFPGGCYESGDLELTQKYGLTVIGWDVNSLDAFNNNQKTIVESIKRNAKPGSIIVFHLHGSKNAPATAKALPEVISYLTEKGYTFVKVSQLLKELNEEPQD